MGRPAKHTADDLVDAAVELFAVHGVRGVTLSAVAEAVGAANGSVYHRFPDRPALLAAVWLRTSTRFQDAYRAELSEPTPESAIDAAAWVVQWCGENLAQAQVLQAGARTFGPDDWTPVAQAAAGNAEIRRELREYVRAIAESSGATPDQIAFAMLELPIAVVRTALHSGRVPGTREIELVHSLATLILRQPRH